MTSASTTGLRPVYVGDWANTFYAWSRTTNPEERRLHVGPLGALVATDIGSFTPVVGVDAVTVAIKDPAQCAGVTGLTISRCYDPMPSLELPGGVVCALEWSAGKQFTARYSADDSLLTLVPLTSELLCDRLNELKRAAEACKGAMAGRVTVSKALTMMMVIDEALLKLASAGPGLRVPVPDYLTSQVRWHALRYRTQLRDVRTSHPPRLADVRQVFAGWNAVIEKLMAEVAILVA